MKTVKTLQLSANLAQDDEQLRGLVREVLMLLGEAPREGIVQFSIEVEHANGGSTKLQYARRDS